MSGHRPGPICGSKLGPDWIDSGTLIRSRSGAPGPLGMVMALVMGAKPGNQDEQKAAEQAMFDYDIDQIEKADIPGFKNKGLIIAQLRSLNRDFKIQYGGNLETSRGDWDGSTIRISDNYRGKSYPTMIELVHEGTHALTTKQKSTRAGNAKTMSNSDEELQSQQNQLLMYAYLRDSKGYEDETMEQRLRDLNSGKLKRDIEDSFKKR